MKKILIVSLTKHALSAEELEKASTEYFFKNGILVRKWRPPDFSASEDWSLVHQIMMPKVCCSESLEVAQELPPIGVLIISLKRS